MEKPWLYRIPIHSDGQSVSRTSPIDEERWSDGIAFEIPKIVPEARDSYWTGELLLDDLAMALAVLVGIVTLFRYIAH